MGDVRGLGLMIGVELVEEDKKPDAVLTRRVLTECEKRGLIVVECGRYKNVVRFMPPLTVKKEEMDEALAIFEEALGSASTG